MHSIPLSIIPILKISEPILWDQLKIIQPTSLNLLVHFRYLIYFFKSLYEKPCCLVSLQLLTLLYSLHRRLTSEMLHFFQFFDVCFANQNVSFTKVGTLSILILFIVMSLVPRIMMTISRYSK